MMYQSPPPGMPVVVVQEQKSVALAVILAFFFGPLGMFYATVTGALVMLGINFLLFFIGFLTLGLGWFLYIFTWIGGIVWAAMEANNQNRKILTPVMPVAIMQPGVVVSGAIPPPYAGQPNPYYQQPRAIGAPYYQQPGATPVPYSNQPVTRYQHSGSMPPPYGSQSNPYQQPGSAPNPYQGPPQ